MTKNERILKQQIKELERLVEIKDEVIKELKTLINRPYYWTSPITYPASPIVTYDGTSLTDTKGSDTFTYTNGTKCDL